MITRRTRFVFFVLFSSFAFCFGWASAPETQQDGASPLESPKPRPSPTVQEILDKADQFAKAKNFQEALRLADQALSAGKQQYDQVGEALAYRSRALALQGLDRKTEAAAAWQAAEAVWEPAGDGPEEIEALAAAGLLAACDQPAESKQLLAQALDIGKGETTRPITAAHAMVDVGLAIQRTRPRPPANARDFFEAALLIQERLRPDSSDTIETMNRLGYLCIGTRDLKAAEHYLNLALARGERIAPNSVTVAHTLDYLGKLETDRENLPKSRDYLERAIALKEALAPNSLDLAETLNGAGIPAAQEGDYSAARKLFQRSLEIAEKLDPESSLVAGCLNGLGIVEMESGDLAATRVYFNHALAIAEKLHGADSPEAASTHINLGDVAHQLGDYATARQEFEHSLAIYAKSAPNAGGVPAALGNLRSVAYEQGDFTSAIAYGERALMLFEKIAPGQLDSAEETSGLGKIYLTKRMFRRAEGYDRRALAIRQTRAPESLDTAGSYIDLGDLAAAEGDLSKAAEFQRRALAIAEKAAPNSLDVASILYKLGETAYGQGEFDTALTYHQRSLDIRVAAVGPDHPDVARSLISMAEVQAAMGGSASAFEAALRAENIAREHLRNSVRFLSERQALSYASARASGLDLALSLVVEGLRNPSAPAELFDSVIHSRAVVLDEMAQRHRAAYEVEDAASAQLAKNVSSASARLAILAVRGPGDVPLEPYRKLLDDARKEKEENERALAEKSTTFREQQKLNQVGLADVTAALPPDSALLSFIRYNQHQFTPGRKSSQAVPSYLAFVLRNGTHAPEVISLGAAQKIEALVKKLREEIAYEALAPSVRSSRSEATYRAVGAALRRRVWDPVAPHLKGAKQVFVVPDGALNLVNLVALPVGRESYLIERGPRVHYLSTERDLVTDVTERKGAGLLALGDPSFNDTSFFAALAPRVVRAKTQTSAQAIAASAKSFRGTRSTCGNFQLLRFERLPASAREVAEIVSLWNKGSTPKAGQLRGIVLKAETRAVPLTGASASDREFAALAPGKRVLHLATHGFFLGGPCESTPQVASTRNLDDQPFPFTAENPLLLAGLAFAGANHRSAARQDETDGILTADEIATMNLQGVEWAVLSACDTGSGEIRAGEGVLGLRRAFQIAGARTVIMSLWSVEDEATREWMGALYRYHFRDAMDTAASVRAASLDVLRLRRLRHLSSHPFYWGGFIAAGDWH